MLDLGYMDLSLCDTILKSNAPVTNPESELSFSVFKFDHVASRGQGTKVGLYAVLDSFRRLSSLKP